MQQKIISQPFVSIVIPHFGSSDIFFTCLDSIALSTYSNFEIVIVDNGSDLEENLLQKYHFKYQYLKNKKNLGFAGGCNVGIKKANGKYILLLNNDTRVVPNWLEPLVEVMEFNPSVAVCQPKLLSSRFEGKLDYAGAMGGLIDIFGYPFAIGRIFDTIEPDDLKYQGDYEIFWASGTASIWKKTVFEKVGYLDEDFFAHMEEIDLNWRCLLHGYKIYSTSNSKVFHYSGYSLGHETWKKMYLNHRNNLVMVFKNLEGNSLTWLFPIRLMMEYFTAFVSLIKFDWKRLFAVILSQLFILFNLKSILYKRRVVQSKRTVNDTKIVNNMFRGSIVWNYFIRRHTTVDQFMEINPIEQK